MNSRTSIFFVLFCLLSFLTFGQNIYSYEPSVEHPFGLPNPDAGDQIMDWAPLIGECHCLSVSRIDQNTWADTINMHWRFKYIMNGTAVQDETLKADGSYAGSIRQYISDSSRWYVHYYNSGAPNPILPTWEGNKTENGDIVLYRDQTTPNGMEGKYKIIFSDMSPEGFNWLGEWVNTDETFIYPTWRIFCKKKL